MIQIELNGAIAPDEVPALRAAVGWGPRQREYPAVFARSFLYASARDAQGQLIAFGYIVSMGLEHGYLEDIMVAPRNQHQGVGSALVRALVQGAKARGLGILTLSTDLATAPFYRQLGFDQEASMVMTLDEMP
ncbi:GNAT family N-acetyltransferase [Lacticaseibacillus daqingensis]|uniref:GNAT family N-acetyltransferase n=1 Tax=Lacticaseibacillus daqingensis TaxID=2486014 RepID=UPI000F796874|nr:GNAT family N-acetyltransferase [Lacticaseibacillus daqingensis]